MSTLRAPRAFPPRSVSISCLAWTLAAVSACSTTQVLQPVSAAAEGGSLVYFIRKSYPPYIREVRISVNGTLAATVSNNDFVAVSVPPGNNTILLEANDGKPLSFKMPAGASKRHYVVFTGDVKKTGQEPTGYNQFTVYLQWTLRAYPVAEAEAKDIVAGFGKRLK